MGGPADYDDSSGFKEGGESGKLDGPWIRVFPSENYQCIIGQQCGYVVEGTGFPVKVLTSDPSLVPDNNFEKKGLYQIDTKNSLLINGCDVLLVFGSESCATSGCGGNNRYVERWIRFIEHASSETNGSNTSTTVTSNNQFPDFAAETNGAFRCQSGEKNCLPLSSVGELILTFDLANAPTEIALVHIDGDWNFGQTFVPDPNGTAIVTCSDGVCKQPITIAPELSTGSVASHVLVAYLDYKAGYPVYVARQLSFSVGQSMPSSRTQ